MKALVCLCRGELDEERRELVLVWFSQWPARFHFTHGIVVEMCKE